MIYLVMKINNKDLEIAKNITQELRQKLGDDLIRVKFYGSRAKGMASKDSDLDLFLLMKNKPEIGSKKNRQIIDTTYKYLLTQGLYVSPVVFDVKSYNKQKNLRFIKEVEEGVEL